MGNKCCSNTETQDNSFQQIKPPPAQSFLNKNSANESLYPSLVSMVNPKLSSYPKSEINKKSTMSTLRRSTNLKDKHQWRRLVQVSGIQKKMAELIGLVKITTVLGEVQLFTGFLLTSRLMATCASAVYNRHSETFSRKIEFYPSLNGQIKDIHPKQIQQVVLHQSYQQNQPNAEDYNIALIKLASFVPTKISMKIGNISDLSKAFVYGYPKLDCENNVEQNDLYYQYGGFGEVMTIGHTLVYEMQSEKGMAGSPIFTVETDKGDDIFNIIGLHLGRGTESSQSKGLLFREQLLGELIEWQYDLQGSSDLSMLNSFIKSQSSLIRSGKKIIKHKGIKWSQFQ